MSRTYKPRIYLKFVLKNKIELIFKLAYIKVKDAFILCRHFSEKLNWIFADKVPLSHHIKIETLHRSVSLVVQTYLRIKRVNKNKMLMHQIRNTFIFLHSILVLQQKKSFYQKRSLTTNAGSRIEQIGWQIVIQRNFCFVGEWMGRKTGAWIPHEPFCGILFPSS